MSPPAPSSSYRFRSHSAAASTSHFVLPPAIPIPSPSPSHPSSSLARSRRSTPRNSPPSDLLDDDPFADLSPAPSTVLYAESSASASSSAGGSPLRLSSIDTTPETDTPLPAHRTPRSPLSNSFPGIPESPDEGYIPWRSPPRTPPSTPAIPLRPNPSSRRPRSSGHGQVRPAYTRPAFSSRPSLPSLHTLAQMHVIVPKVSRAPFVEENEND